MKKLSVALFLTMLLLCAACSEESSGGGSLFDTSSMYGDMEPVTWNFMLQSMPELAKYFIKVEKTGGSGNAVISARKVVDKAETPLGNFTVYAGVGIPLTAYGPTIQFSDSGGSLNLVAGDQWVMMVDSSQLVGIFPTGLNASTNYRLAMTAPATVPKCQYGLFNALPGISMSIGGVPQQLSAGIMHVEAGDYFTTGDVPETSMLLFSTAFPLLPGSVPVVQAGDQIEVSYDRNFISDGQGGDFFEVLAVSDRRLQLLDLVQGQTEPTQNVVKVFTSDGNFVGIEFIFGLSGSSDSAKIDNFSFRVNGVELFSDNFEGQSLKLGYPNFVWMPASPSVMLGSAGLCSYNALSSAQSWCVNGGRAWTLYGMGAEMNGITGLEFTITDGSVGSSFFEGAFMGMVSNSVMSGTYSGKNYDSTCAEQGAFVDLIDPSQTAYAAGNWNLGIQAQLKNCDNPADEGLPLAFTVTNASMLQVSTLFGGLLQASPLVPPFQDSMSDVITMSGFVNGNSLMAMMATTVPSSIFYRLSLSGAADSWGGSGTVMGWAARNPLALYQTCEVEGMFTLAVSP